MQEKYDSNYIEDYVEGNREIEISYEKDNVICAGDIGAKYHSVYISLDYIESFSRALYSSLDFNRISIIGDERYVSVISFNKCVNYVPLSQLAKIRVKKLKDLIYIATEYARKGIEDRVSLSIEPLVTIKGASGGLTTNASSSDRTFNSEQKNELWESSGGYCSTCGMKMTPFKGHSNSFEADHITAHSKGGSTSIYNGQALCRTCNRKKSNS